MEASVLTTAPEAKRYMKNSFCAMILFLFVTAQHLSAQPRVLIFSRTCGYHHASIPIGIAAIQGLGKTNGFETDTTTDAGWFTAEVLKKYKAVIFLNTTDTTGVLLNPDQKAAF